MLQIRDLAANLAIRSIDLDIFDPAARLAATILDVALVWYMALGWYPRNIKVMHIRGNFHSIIRSICMRLLCHMMCFVLFIHHNKIHNLCTY